jgi:hypothetical protein
MSTLEQMEERMKAMEHEIESLRAANEIQKIMGRYEVVHNPLTMWRTPVDCFALTMPDVSMEVSDWGVWVGAEAVTYLFGTVMKEEPKGTMFIHTLATPVIEVAGDGMTAKGIWHSPGFETQIDSEKIPHGFWCWGSYSVDFIKENGLWKIWHMKWWRTFRTDYYKSWTESWKEIMTGPPKRHNFKTDPITFFHPYDTATPREPYPVNPQPYETYEGTMSDWVFGTFKDEYFKDATPTSAFEFAHGKKAGNIENNPSADL